MAKTIVKVYQGGTGVETLTDGGILLGSGAGAVTATAVLADGEILVGDGTTDPALESGATLRTSIGVDAAGTDNSTNVTLVSVTGNYLALSGQAVTAGTVPLTLGGTGSTTDSAARTALGVAIGSDVQAYDADTAKLDVAQTFTAGQRGGITALTSSTSITLDMDDANNFSLTLDHDTTFGDPTNLTAGQSGCIVITQGSTGGTASVYGTKWHFEGGTAPTLSTATGAVDTLVWFVASTSSIHAVLLKDMS